MMAQVAPTSAPFMFVNKDSASKSLSNDRIGRKQRLTILSHAQRNSWRAGRQRRKPIPSATRSLVGWQTKTRPPESIVSSDESTSPGDSSESEKSMDRRTSASSTSSQALFIRPTMDSAGTSSIILDEEQHSILHYYNTVWMPSQHYIPPNCHIGGMSPLYDHDAELSLSVVRSSLLTADEVHIYALLAAASSRMRFIAKATLPRPDAFELYTHKALQALQKYIDNGGEATDRLVLDLCYLTLAEIYAQHPTRPRIYWQMMQPFVLACGGFPQLSILSSVMCMGTDYLMAISAVELPTFDIFAHPALLGIQVSKSMTKEQLKEAIETKMATLETRKRLVCYELICLAETMRFVHQLPEEAITVLRGLVTQSAGAMYRLMTTPLQHRYNHRANADVAHDAILAEGRLKLAKSYACILWVWHSGLAFTDTSFGPSLVPGSREAMKKHAVALGRNVESAESLVETTDWRIGHDFLGLWAATLQMCVFADDVDHALQEEAASRFGQGSETGQYLNTASASR